MRVNFLSGKPDAGAPLWSLVVFHRHSSRSDSRFLCDFVTDPAAVRTVAFRSHVPEFSCFCSRFLPSLH